MPRLISFLLHPSGLPHAETFGLPPAMQWGVVGLVLVTGVWLAFDGRGSLGGAGGSAGFGDEGEVADGPLVVGRRGDAVAADSPHPPTPSPLRGRGGAAASGGTGDGGAVDADVAWMNGDTPAVGTMHASPGGRDGASTPRGEAKTAASTGMTGTFVSAGTARRWAPPVWLNPIRVLTAVLGIGAGVVALDRARAIMALDAMLGTDGTLRVSRLAVGLTVLFCVGGALAMPAPRVAAAVFVGAAGLAGFFALAGEWEARLRWWGAEYALTAWDDLWVWCAVGVGLAGLAVVGGWYRGNRAASAGTSTKAVDGQDPPVHSVGRQRVSAGDRKP